MSFNNDLGGGSYTYTEIPKFVTVGRYSSIAKDIIFHPFNLNHLCVTNREVVYTTNWEQPQGLGQIVIGNDVWIGEGVRILTGVTIGDGAIIGAATVLGKDVPPYAVVVGNPQVIKRFRFRPNQIEKLLKIRWWDWPDDWVDQRKQDMKSVNGFIEKYYE